MKIPSILLCLLCLTACKSKPAAPKFADEPVVIDVDKALHTSGELRLSDIADSISFVPIYDGNSAYIGDARRMEMTPDHILVYDMSDRLVCYSFKDRTSRQIGMRGRGPREYLRMEAIAADQESDAIYVLARNRLDGRGNIFKYDFNGNFSGGFSLDEDADEIGLTGEGNVVMHFTNYAGNGKNQYLVMNGRSEIITTYPNPFSYRLSGERLSWFGESAKYVYRGDLHIKDKSDTLYVFRGAERYPKYIFKNSYSIDGRKTLTQTEYDSAFVLDYVFETDTKLVFNGRLGGSEYDKWHHFYYDKITGQTYSINRDIANDLTGGFPAIFRQATSDTTFGDCYVKITSNTHSTVPGYPQYEDASYFLMLFHLK